MSWTAERQPRSKADNSGRVGSIRWLSATAEYQLGNFRWINPGYVQKVPAACGCKDVYGDFTKVFTGTDKWSSSTGDDDDGITQKGCLP